VRPSLQIVDLHRRREQGYRELLRLWGIGYRAWCRNLLVRILTCMCMHTTLRGMRTTIEIPDEQRAKLLKLAAERGEKGFSRLVQEALERYLDEQEAYEQRVQAALAALGTLSEEEAAELEESVQRLRSTWR
jgi:predicted transcriptional regulator